MPRAKAPPRVKGPYCERGGSRFRIRVCDPTGYRDLYFATLHEAQAGFKQATCELAHSSKSRLLGNILDEYTSDRVQRGLCATQSAHDERLRLRHWLAGSLQEDLGKLTTKHAAGYYERLVVTATRKTGRYRQKSRPRDEFWRNFARTQHCRRAAPATSQDLGRPAQTWRHRKADNGSHGAIILPAFAALARHRHQPVVAGCRPIPADRCQGLPQGRPTAANVGTEVCRRAPRSLVLSADG